jgi:hypothetical protein
MTNLTRTRRTGPGALGLAAALLLCGLGPHRADAQQAVPTAPALPSDPPPDVAPLFDDPHESIRKGLLFYAVSPRTEKDLRRLGATSAPFSVTIPIEVDRANSRVHVAADIDGRKVRLILDTGGGPRIILNDAAAEGLKLRNLHTTTLGGAQGNEAVTEGLAPSMTLGRLTLGGIGVMVKHDVSSYDASTLGTEVFERYRLTLDFGAKTMTLARGGGPVASPTNTTSISMPFRNDSGDMFIPVRVLDRPAWAMIDSGSDVNELSLGAAKHAAAQLPPSESVTLAADSKIGTGSTHPSVTALVLGVPVPIFIKTGQADALADGFRYGTTSQIGLSFIEDEFNQYHSVPTGVILGLPFLLQFRRVTIDYPNHLLTLEQPEHGVAVLAAVGAKGPNKVWPGYEWRRVGDGWVEAPLREPPRPP